jgi:hypothetical protein
MEINENQMADLAVQRHGLQVIANAVHELVNAAETDFTPANFAAPTQEMQPEGAQETEQGKETEDEDKPNQNNDAAKMPEM